MKTPPFDQPDQPDEPDQQPPRTEMSQPETAEPFTSDAQILRPTTAGAAEGIALDVRRLAVGARVYSADGVEVAVVETIQPNRVTIRAGSPGRPVDLPLNALQRVGDDGHRLELRFTRDDIERLVGGDEPGYAHLTALQPDDLAQRDPPTRPNEPSQP